MATTLDARRASLELATISADLRRPSVGVDDLLAIGARLSHLATEIAVACERAFLAAVEEVAA